MADYPLDLVQSNECIGNSLSTFNVNFKTIADTFAALDNKINSVSASDLQKVVQLIPGSNIAITPTEVQGVYMVDALGAGASILSNTAVISGANVGTVGARVFKRKSADRNLEFRRLVSGGSNILISEEGDTIKFTAFDPSGRTGGETNTTSNQGSGVGIAMPKRGVDLPLKSLVPGNGIAITSQASSVQIESTIQATGVNVGDGAGVFKYAFGNHFTFKTLTSGSSNVIVQDTPEEIRLTVVDTLTAQNTPLGVGIFKEKDLFTNKLVFKGLVGSSVLTATNISPCEVTFTPTANSVNLTVVDKVTGVNVPVTTFVPPYKGEAGKIFKNKVGNTLNFKNLIPGENIKITNSLNNNEVIISTTADVLSAGEANEGINLGGGIEVYKEKNGVQLAFRTLSAGSGINLIESSDTILVSAAAFPSIETFVTKDSLTGFNVGGGSGLFNSVSGSGLIFKTLSATTPYITVIPTSNTVTLSVGNVVSKAQNDPASGITGGIFKNQIGDTLNFRKIAAGAGISIQEQTGNVVISNTYSIPAFLTNLGNGFKNRIINGNCDIWQRQKIVGLTPTGSLSTGKLNSVSFSGNSTTFGYLADRIGVLAGSKASGIVDPTVSVSKIDVDFSDTTAAGMLSACNPTSALRVTLGLRPTTTFVPTTVGQRIENVRSLAGRTVTFSFWARSNNVGSSNINISYMQCYKPTAVPFNVGCYQYPSTVVQTIPLNATWSRVNATFTLPEISPSFWAGLWGSEKDEPVWNSFTQIGIEILGSQSRYVDIVGLQLEENSVMTDFEKRPLGIELNLCQRYYETGDRLQTQFATNSANITYTPFKVTKRRAPTMSIASGVILKNSIPNNPNLFVVDHTFDTSSIDSFTTSFTGDNIIVNAKPFIYNWVASAEL